MAVSASCTILALSRHVTISSMTCIYINCSSTLCLTLQGTLHIAATYDYDYLRKVNELVMEQLFGHPFCPSGSVLGHKRLTVSLLSMTWYNTKIYMFLLYSLISQHNFYNEWISIFSKTMLFIKILACEKLLFLMCNHNELHISAWVAINNQSIFLNLQHIHFHFYCIIVLKTTQCISLSELHNF
jgi:hypothetical protein